MSKKIDALFEDPPIANQSWCCISFISPETVKNCNFRGIKVRGVYATREEAEKRAHELQEIDPDFHIFVGEIGKWLGWDPDPNSIEDQQYKEAELQKIMTEYKKNREKAKLMEQERKREIMEDSARNEAGKESKQKERLQKKLAESRAAKKIKEIEEDRKNISEATTYDTPKLSGAAEKLLKEEEQKIAENEKKIHESTQNLKSADEKINRLQQLYKEMTNKKKSNN